MAVAVLIRPSFGPVPTKLSEAFEEMGKNDWEKNWWRQMKEAQADLAKKREAEAEAIGQVGCPNTDCNPPLLLKKIIPKRIATPQPP